MTKRKPQIQESLPHDIDLEKAILYCFIMDSSLVKSSRLHEKDFYRTGHSIIYHTISSMVEDGAAVDYTTLYSTLKDKGLFEEVGGAAYINSFSDLDPSVLHYPTYEEQLKDLSTRREIFNIAHELLKAARGNGQLADHIAQAKHLLHELDASAGGSIASRVEAWVRETSGNFMVTELYKDLEITTTGNKKAALMALRRLEPAGLVVRCGTKRGCYTAISDELVRMDIITEKTSQEYELMWPSALPIHEMIKLYPGALVVIEGQPQSGKTALALNMIRLNLELPHIKRVRYFNSEMGEEELKERLKQFELEGIPKEFWKNRKLEAYERSEDFAAVIDPDGLNIIDYLEVYEEFYMIGKHLTHIHRRLDDGIAIVCIQRDPSKPYGKGGSVVREKPRLVISLTTQGTCKIEKGKTPRRPGIRPDGKVYHYWLRDGCRFIQKTAPVQKGKGGGDG